MVHLHRFSSLAMAIFQDFSNLYKACNNGSTHRMSIDEHSQVMLDNYIWNHHFRVTFQWHLAITRLMSPPTLDPDLVLPSCVKFPKRHGWFPHRLQDAAPKQTAVVKRCNFQRKLGKKKAWFQLPTLTFQNSNFHFQKGGIYLQKKAFTILPFGIIRKSCLAVSIKTHSISTLILKILFVASERNWCSVVFNPHWVARVKQYLLQATPAYQPSLFKPLKRCRFNSFYLQIASTTNWGQCWHLDHMDPGAIGFKLQMIRSSFSPLSISSRLKLVFQPTTWEGLLSFWMDFYEYSRFVGLICFPFKQNFITSQAKKNTWLSTLQTCTQPV